MVVRKLNAAELLPALHLVWEVFAVDVAPGYSPQGVGTFQEFIKYENMNAMVNRGELIFFGAYEGVELVGTGAIRKDGHISLLFVKKIWQRRGVGRQLFGAMYTCAFQELHAIEMTVNAAPGAAEAYHHYGMRDKQPMQMANGISFIPMGMPVTAPKKHSVYKKNDKIILIVAAVVAVLVLGALSVRSLIHEWNLIKDEVQQSIGEYGEYGSGEELPDYGYDPDGDAAEDGSETELSGIDAIPEYKADDVSYQIKDESYVFQDDETKTTMVQFEVYYPQLEGLKDSTVQEKINTALKDCATESVDKLYTNPSQEIKEKVLQEEYPVIASFVRYKVSYMTEDVISVVFEDYIYAGSGESYTIGLRTKNISLKDGSEYEVKDIVNLNDDFMEDWLQIMQSEADDNTFLDELDMDKQKAALEGKDGDGTYLPVFFLDEEGIEIGYDLSYKEGDSNNKGYEWVTAPFTMDEIEDYKTDSDLWKYVK